MSFIARYTHKMNQKCHKNTNVTDEIQDTSCNLRNHTRSASNVRCLCALLCPAISFLHFHVQHFQRPLVTYILLLPLSLTALDYNFPMMFWRYKTTVMELPLSEKLCGTFIRLGTVLRVRESVCDR